MISILLIEDNADINETTSEMLELAGYKVKVAKNGVEGIDLSNKYKPDIILCDILMPKLNGYQVLDKIRQIPEMKKVPFVFVTAKSEKSDVKKGIRMGVDAYLCKPFTERELLKIVKQLTIDL